jgi:hypothetical protein
MRTALILLLLSACATISTAAGKLGSRAQYIGGTRSDIAGNVEGWLEVSDKIYFVFQSKHTKVCIPYERINLLEYGERVDRQFAAAVLISPLLMLAKKRQHFLTVGFQDDDGQQQALVFKVNKDDIRMALVSLEARTGREVQYQDNEARMSGKG